MRWLTQLPWIEIEPAEVCGRVRLVEPAFHRSGDGLRLFENLLEHVVRETAAIAFAGVPFDFVHLRRDASVFVVEYVKLIRADNAELVILQIHDLPRVTYQCGWIGREEVLVIADADDQRTAEPSADDQVRILRADNGRP
jgi:hypothetical protein